MPSFILFFMNPQDIDIIVGCEESQAITIEFRKLGFNAFSCDTLECSGGHPEWHLQMDIFEALKLKKWKLGIFHPPCTRLTLTANKWYKPEYAHRFPTIHEDREKAVDFFMKLANADIEYKAIENPVGIMSTRFRKPEQYIQPYEYGHPESKKTGLWLFGLPKLKPTDIVEPEFIMCQGKRYSKTHYDHKGGVKNGGTIRSKTYPGIAHAIATQYGSFLLNGA